MDAFADAVTHTPTPFQRHSLSCLIYTLEPKCMSSQTLVCYQMCSFRFGSVKPCNRFVTDHNFFGIPVLFFHCDMIYYL